MCDSYFGGDCCWSCSAVCAWLWCGVFLVLLFCGCVCLWLCFLVVGRVCVWFWLLLCVLVGVRVVMLLVVLVVVLVVSVEPEALSAPLCLL